MGKKKDFKYKKAKENITIEELEDMKVKEPNSISYGRVNITIEKPLLTKIADLRSNETRSGYFSRLAREDLKKVEKEKTLMKWAKQTKNMDIEIKKEIEGIVNSFPHDHIP
ncbi:hypothetical protein COV24_03310 [candidate division WWE3 bacterium CG10_big_fil_rev_8_21_14_0_10_32_10]|uniref:Uncharacterized protein n=1 Tax=candidate division WWE3 bacterium CG10_big_fil_rev_8_21_14_0_10_32_10 TaxID=1975090 RepID=A0A2H0RAF3_UNCKA|nr:MAG: hypothetical protein COV24_03310 [candidate division WWE3 bacterium CG10_big_fil_rev_8_21_14_0_10_32_10]